MATEIERPYTVLKISTDNGPLAQIWLASNMTNIPRGSVLQTNIKDSAEEIARVSGCIPNVTASETEGYLTLRTSGELLQGIVRVYAKQAGFLLSDIKDTLTKISSLFKISSRVNVTISKVTTISRIDQLILEDAVTEEDVLITPNLDFLEDHFGRTSLTTATTTGNLGDHLARRDLYGAATTWDRSIEVGRGVIAQTQVSETGLHGNTSAFDLDFDIDGTVSPVVDTSAEGTRTNFHLPVPSGDHGVTHNTLLDNAQDDFSLGTAVVGSPQDWDLGIMHPDVVSGGGNGVSNDLGDESIEIGRRAADTSLLEERTDFGFDLEIEKEQQQQQQQQQQQLHPADTEFQAGSSNAQLLQQLPRLPRRIKITDSALINTTELIVDEGTELQQPQLRRVVTNRQEGDKHGSVPATVRLTQKRIWEEMVRELGFLPSLALDSLVSYHKLKKQRLGPVTDQSQDQEPQMDLSLNLDSEVLGTTGYPDVPGPASPNGPEDLTLEDMGVQDLSFNGSPYRSSEEEEEGREENMEPHSDQVQLNTGEMASKRMVDMAEVLRGHSGLDSQVTFDSVIREQHGEETSISRTDASKGLLSLLSLASAGCVDLRQDEPFGKIMVSTRAPLFEKYISV